MNEVNNQGPRQELSRASSVSEAKRQVAKNTGGKTLPRDRETLAADDAKVKQTRANQEVSRRKVEAAVKRMNEYTQSTQRDLRFNMDEASGRMVVNVVDRESKEVIRQIPDEIFLRMARKLKDDLNAGEQQPLRLINVSA